MTPHTWAAAEESFVFGEVPVTLATRLWPSSTLELLGVWTLEAQITDPWLSGTVRPHLTPRARSPRDLVLNFLTWFHILSPSRVVMEHKWVVELGWDPGRPVSRVCAVFFLRGLFLCSLEAQAQALPVTVGKSGHLPNTQCSH